MHPFSLFLVLFLFFLPNFQITAHPAWGIVVDAQRNVYFPDIAHFGGSIWKLTPSGEVHRLLDQCHAHNISLDTNGNLITAHGEDSSFLICMDTDGKQLDTILRSNDMEFFYGGNCTWSPKGYVIFGIRNQIYAQYPASNGPPFLVSDHWLEWNQTVYAAPNGTIYVPDIGTQNGVIVRIDSSGASKIIASDLISKLDRPKDKHGDVLLGITEGCDRHIYVAELAGKRIIKILENGQTKTFYQSKGDWFPTGIDFFSGDAYIMEYRFDRSGMKGPRITRISETGQQATLFEYETYFEKGGNTIEVLPPPDNSLIKWWLVLVLLVGMVSVPILLLNRRLYEILFIKKIIPW